MSDQDSPIGKIYEHVEDCAVLPAGTLFECMEKMKDDLMGSWYSWKPVSSEDRAKWGDEFAFPIEQMSLIPNEECMNQEYFTAKPDYIEDTLKVEIPTKPCKICGEEILYCPSNFQYTE